MRMGALNSTESPFGAECTSLPLTRRGFLHAGALATSAALLASCSSEKGSDRDAGRAGEPDERGEAAETGGDAEEASDATVHTVQVCSPAGCRTRDVPVDVELAGAVKRNGLDHPQAPAQFQGKVESVSFSDLDTEVTGLFYRRGWTDGLPISAPTEERVSAMLAGTHLPKDSVVAKLAPMNGEATVEKIAVNAVMAGCRPAYLPFIIAAVQAAADPDFDLVGLSTTTGPAIPLVIAGGPAAAQAGINAGSNALGRGWAANATIGRAVQLTLQNVGGSWPGVSDFSSLGMPGDYGACMAEAEDESPWEPLGQVRGVEAGESSVTLVAAEGMQLVVDIGVDAEGFLGRVARYIAARDRLGSELLLVLTPSTAAKLAKAGFDRESIRSHLDGHARVTPSQAAELSASVQGRSSAFVDRWGQPDEEGMVAGPFIGGLAIAVAGGVGEKNALVPLWSKPVTRRVSLPGNWDELVESLERDPTTVSES